MAPYIMKPSDVVAMHIEGKEDRAKKDTEGKLRLDLIPPESIFELARVYTLGAEKYGDRNWEKGLPVEECIAALDRHILRFKLGQYTNPDTGIHEIAHAAFWCFAIVSQYHRLFDQSSFKKRFDTEDGPLDPIVSFLKE